MTETVRITVVTSCTGEKATESPRQLRLEDFWDRQILSDRERELAELSRPAGTMYTGGQHRHLMVGVNSLRACFGRDAVNLQIVSAGYGLVSEDTVIAPYNVTFKAMGRGAALAWGRRLAIAESVRGVMRESQLTVLLLGEEYVRVVEPPIAPAPGHRVIFLAKPTLRKHLEAPRTTIVPIGLQDTRRYHAGYVALKGRMFELFAKGLVRQGVGLWRDVCDDPTPKSFRTAVESGVTSDD